jgi:hypothetical protein
MDQCSEYDVRQRPDALVLQHRGCDAIVLDYLGGGRLSPLGTSTTIGLLYQPRMIDDECGAVGGMRIGRGNRSTRRKPAILPLCPPQIPHDLTWARKQASSKLEEYRGVQEVSL